MDYKEIKKLQKIVKKHQAAYTIGLHSDTDNTYPVRSEKFQAFNIGRLERLRKLEGKKG
jgi:hypothetical protein